MASGTAAGEAQRPTSHRARLVLVRMGLMVLSCLAVMVFTSWDRSRLPIGARIVELVLCILAWEAAVLLCQARLRTAVGGTLGSLVAAESPAGLGVRVLAASLPATAGMWAIFRLVGEPLASPLTLYGQSLLLGLLLAFARRGLMRGRLFALPPPLAASADRKAPASPVPATAGEALLRRHAPKLAGHRLIALEAEDHYLRFHTDGGTALVLMRLRDAVAALGPDAGWQPHRSFWLAAGATARAERNGQGWTLTLPNGLVVPVSRANIARLRDAGYAEPPLVPVRTGGGS